MSIGFFEALGVAAEVAAKEPWWTRRQRLLARPCFRPTTREPEPQRPPSAELLAALRADEGGR